MFEPDSWLNYILHIIISDLICKLSDNDVFNSFYYDICLLNPNKSPQKKVDVVQDEKELAFKWAELPWCSVSLVHRAHISKRRLESFVSVSC